MSNTYQQLDHACLSGSEEDKSSLPWRGSLDQQIAWIARETERCRATATRLPEPQVPAHVDRTLRLMDGEWVKVVPIPGLLTLIKSALWALRHWKEGLSSWCPQRSATPLVPGGGCPACAAGIEPTSMCVWVPIVLHSAYDFDSQRWEISQDHRAWLLPLTQHTYSKNSDALNLGDCIWWADRATGYGINVERHGSYCWEEQRLHEALARLPVPVLRLDRKALNAIAREGAR
jgi:hypothetical protein